MIIMNLTYFHPKGQEVWKAKATAQLKLPDVLERQGLSLNLLLKLVMSLILEKHFVVLSIFQRP